MARDLGEVVRKMVRALRAETLPVRAANGDAVSMPLLIGVLESAAFNASFTAPEVMRVRWLELVQCFNATVFGTKEESAWDRTKAPQWAMRAGRILSGEDAGQEEV